MDQMIVNLLSNAIKHGRGKPIRIFVLPGEKETSVSFRDEGIGISPADRDRIFLRFERAFFST